MLLMTQGALILSLKHRDARSRYVNKNLDRVRASIWTKRACKIDNVLVMSKEESFQRKLCIYCKKLGHRHAEFPTRPRRRIVSRPKSRISKIEIVKENKEEDERGIVYDQ